MKTRAARRPPHERRKLILEGAERVFAAAGYGGADTTALARAGGVSAPALYRYFPTKKDLYIATLQTAARRLVEIWRRIVDEAADPLEAMTTIAGGYYEHGGSQPSVMRLWFQALSDTDAPEVRAALRENFTALAGLLEECLREAKVRRLIDTDVDPRMAAWDFMSIGFTFELSRLIGMGDKLDRRSFDAWRRHYFTSIGVRRTRPASRRVVRGA